MCTCLCMVYFGQCLVWDHLYHSGGTVLHSHCYIVWCSTCKYTVVYPFYSWWKYRHFPPWSSRLVLCEHNRKWSGWARVQDFLDFWWAHTQESAGRHELSSVCWLPVFRSRPTSIVLPAAMRTPVTPTIVFLHLWKLLLVPKHAIFTYEG